MQGFRPTEDAGVWIHPAGARRAQVALVSAVSAQDGPKVQKLLTWH